MNDPMSTAAVRALASGGASRSAADTRICPIVAVAPATKLMATKNPNPGARAAARSAAPVATSCSVTWRRAGTRSPSETSSTTPSA